MSSSVNQILKSIKDREGPINILGLEGSSLSYLASLVWSQLQRPVLVISADSKDASSIKDNLDYFCGGTADGSISLFPAPDTLPYTALIPQPDIQIERLKTLFEVINERAPIIIAPITGLLRNLPPKEVFVDNILQISLGQRLNKEEFLLKLQEIGYVNSPLVEEDGDFASRGFIIDLWSPISDRPTRIELDGDRVASIRRFDPASQKASYTKDRVTAIPVKNVILDPARISVGLKRLKIVADEIGVSAVERRELAEVIRARVYPSVIETLLPIFYPKPDFLWDYLPKDTIVFIDDPHAIRQTATNLHQELDSRHKEAKNIERVVKPTDLYKNCATWEEELAQFQAIRVGGLQLEGTKTIKVDTANATAPTDVWIVGSSETTLAGFIEKLRYWNEIGCRVITTCHTPTQADRLIDLLRWQGITPVSSDRPFMEEVGAVSVPRYRRTKAAPTFEGKGGVVVTIASLSQGFVWPDEKLVVLTEREMFGKGRRRKIVPTKIPAQPFTSFKDLEEGDLLVHLQHGVGRFGGLVQMEIAKIKNDFLQVEYLGGDRLYVPAYRLGQVQKYIGPGDASPILDKLGGTRWARAKLKANRAIRKIAAELLKLYATRKVKSGFAFSGRDHLMEEFETAFPFDETPDQMQAIEDVIRDMTEPHPADRLICGDVGYGKTEVAMRAAFRAAMDGKQVAILVPTTILAFQHFETFTQRFKNTPITIELLNRFKSRAEQKKIINAAAKGSADIIIGTHKLLQKEVSFKDLGFLVIDEEHRFGVRQKEAIKKLRTNLDVVSMSATPIPRTLNISLVGIRDISIINTPPQDRMSIRTYVAEFDEGLIRSAILKEIGRGGQCFFVHNRVETIESMRARLERIVPEAKICVAHGQMKERELEKIMISFLEKKYDLLLTTTIIESGIDIPTANTIIINRADTFGLAQLYQLRGRVGRSNLQAYALLMVPVGHSITPTASKRLAALQRYTELGSGFQIAMHDLEIRGSGNILGAQQSGHIGAIGYELYIELLEKEIRKLKGMPEDTKPDTEIQIPIEAYIPHDYIDDDGTRIVFYKRISALQTEEEIDDIAGELADRFGGIPDRVKNLLKVVEIRIRASCLGIESIQYSNGNFIYRFSDRTPISPERILELVKNNEEEIKLKPPSTLVITEGPPSSTNLFAIIKKHLTMF